MVKIIVKIVDSLFVLKRLKVTLFFLFVLLLLLVADTILSNFDICFINFDEKILAALMIGISALMASTVAIINMRKITIEREEDRKNYLISISNNFIIRIGFFKESHSLYNKNRTKYFYIKYKKRLKDVLKLVNDKEFNKNLIGDESLLIYEIYKQIIEILSSHDNLDFKNALESNIENYNKLKENIIKLEKYIIKVREKELINYKKIFEEEKL